MLKTLGNLHGFDPILGGGGGGMECIPIEFSNGLRIVKVSSCADQKIFDNNLCPSICCCMKLLFVYSIC